MHKIFTVIAVLFITSCTSINNFKQTDKSTPEQNVSAFNKALANEYYDLASLTFRSGNWFDSLKFKQKAQSAEKGIEVYPEAIKNWGIKGSEADNLHWASKRLDNVMVDTVKENHPARLAHLQRLYDCWLERVARGKRISKIEECRMDFVLEAAELENILMPVSN